MNFDPKAAGFTANAYAQYRASGPIASSPDGTTYVLSYPLVQQVCERTADFLKPGKDRGSAVPRPYSAAASLGDGLFYMDPPRHTEVRALMNGVFASILSDAATIASARAQNLLSGVVPGTPFDVVAVLAHELPKQLFVDIMGTDRSDQGELATLDRWIGAAMRAHDPSASPSERIAGADATFTLRTYFLSLLAEQPRNTSAGGPSIAGGMKQITACPMTSTKMSPCEAMNTAVNLGLGGYLSTEFLIATGTYNLLSSGAWQQLGADRSLLSQALQEMLRYDAPFQMADRWVADDCELGSTKLEKGSNLVVVYGAANRDAGVFADPDTFDITRPAVPNFGFGHGIHYCIGEAVALKIAEAAFTALLDRLPDAKLVEVGNWSTDPYFRTLKELFIS
ncbi:MAG: cytochrome P450 [Proteobacteria bacterium]|nr:cytochrome P450 [Pseudomonadota bacterium]